MLLEDHFAAIKVAYCEAMGELNDGNKKFLEPSNENLNQSTRMHIVSSCSLQPEIELPKFKTSLQKWLNFKSMFVTMV